MCRTTGGGREGVIPPTYSSVQFYTPPDSSQYNSLQFYTPDSSPLYNILNCFPALGCWETVLVIGGGNTNRTRGICTTQPLHVSPHPRSIAFKCGCFGKVFNTRSLGALRALTSRWRPLDFVPRALRPLRPCDPRKVDQHLFTSTSRMHKSMIQESIMHISMLHVSIMYVSMRLVSIMRIHDAYISDLYFYGAYISDPFFHDAYISDPVFP